MARLKYSSVILILISLLAGVFTGCKPQFQPGTYTDDMGRPVTIDKIPQRLVSHVPSITETLFALGLEDKVVGVSDFCNYPEEAKSKPRVGNYFNPSIESIVALNPDLVLTDGHSQNISQLDSLGIKFIVLDPKDIDGILRNIELLGEITGIQKKARELMDSMRQDMASTLSRVKDVTRIRVLYVFDATDLNNPWTAGPGSLADSLITMAGGTNVAAQAKGAWIQLSIEQIVSSDPQIILLQTQHGTAEISKAQLKGHPAWREMTAVKRDSVYPIDGDLVNLPGPRIVRGLRSMAEIIHPEQFK